METYLDKSPASDAADMFKERKPSAIAVHSPPKPAVLPQQAVKKILVVDDNKDYRELIRHLLIVNHYGVFEAANGVEALPLINKLNPDLVLVDFNMPKMNGYELIQEIRSNFDTRKMRIIMFTGAANRQHLKTLNMDISDFLEKPVPNTKLLESITHALGAGRPAAPERKVAPRPRAEDTAGPMLIEPQPVSLAIDRFGAGEPAQRAVSVGGASRVSPAAVPPQNQSDIRSSVGYAAATAATASIQLPAETVPEAAAQAEIQLPLDPVPEAEIPQEVPSPLEAVPEESIMEMDEMSAEAEHELELIDSGTEHKEEALDVSGLENLTNDSPLIQRVNKILMAAVAMRASDIHIEPNETRVIVRVRVDGILKQLTTLPISIHPRLTARIKIMSNLIITERRIPQDGQFRVQINGQKIEFRVSTLPCIKGEKIVMRILGQSKLNTSISELDMTPREMQVVERSLKSPNGLILVTGPTGSGKTTTLYTMINVLNRPEVNIMTAEDPVEYEVPNINQVKIRPVVGLTFESTLRAFLRQDPDIMLVGEIRDLETAEIAIKASITGHLVFSTLHTNSAPATVVRLTHMGVAPYLVAASVKLVMAQRLVRLLCPHCKKPGLPTVEDKKFLTAEELGRFKNVYHPGGCSRCNQGYSGRKPVFEVMTLESSAMRQLITSNNNVDLLTELAVKEGMTTLRQSALDVVQQGYTSMHEALKVMMG